MVSRVPSAMANSGGQCEDVGTDATERLMIWWEARDARARRSCGSRSVVMAVISFGHLFHMADAMRCGFADG